MHRFYNQFLEFVDQEDKERCLDFILSKLKDNQIDIVTLYNEILTPVLNNFKCKESEQEFCIWKEHVRSSIIRTILECCYPYIIKERNAKYKFRPADTVVVFCPAEELHEIGPRMVADFFTLLGFNVTFVGANTPWDNIKTAIEHIKPRYIAMSITNFYNLSVGSRTVSELIQLRKQYNLEFKLIVGGQAFRSNPEFYKTMGADKLIQTFTELKTLVGVA